LQRTWNTMGQMKHLDLAFFWLRDKVAEGRIQVVHLRTEGWICLQTCWLKKVLPKPQVLKLRRLMGLAGSMRRCLIRGLCWKEERKRLSWSINHLHFVEVFDQGVVLECAQTLSTNVFSFFSVSFLLTRTISYKQLGRLCICRDLLCCCCICKLSFNFVYT
jgi:hypothetical protein